MPARTLLVLALWSSAAMAQTPIVTVSHVQIRSGPGDAALWSRILRRDHNRVSYCYQRQLLSEPALEGRIAIDLNVAADGRIASVRLGSRSMPPNEAFDGCLTRVLGTLRGIPTTAPSVLGLVIVFRSEGAPAVASSSDVETARNELANARREARCLSRAATHLERTLAEWEAARGAARERIAARVAEARAAISACHGAGLLGTNGTLTGLLTGLQQCPPGCMPAVPIGPGPYLRTGL